MTRTRKILLINTSILIFLSAFAAVGCGRRATSTKEEPAPTIISAPSTDVPVRRSENPDALVKWVGIREEFNSGVAPKPNECLPPFRFEVTHEGRYLAGPCKTDDWQVEGVLAPLELEQLARLADAAAEKLTTNMPTCEKYGADRMTAIEIALPPNSRLKIFEEQPKAKTYCRHGDKVATSALAWYAHSMMIKYYPKPDSAR